MNPETIRYLNEINRKFYETTAAAFDETRSTPWPGWEMLLPHIPQKPLRVLDVGCGNGRFGAFLAQHLDAPIVYHGQDNSPALLEFARDALAEKEQLTVQLEQRDVVMQPPDAGEYDLVVAFGLLHHIPGYIQRQQFVRYLSQRVMQGGLLAFACWRFYEYERFRERIVSWDDGVLVEKHDYLLDWRRGETALRYCHYVDDEENQSLVDVTGLRLITTYMADGFNFYSILRNTP